MSGILCHMTLSGIVGNVTFFSVVVGNLTCVLNSASCDFCLE